MTTSTSTAPIPSSSKPICAAADAVRSAHQPPECHAYAEGTRFAPLPRRPPLPPALHHSWRVARSPQLGEVLDGVLLPVRCRTARAGAGAVQFLFTTTQLDPTDLAGDGLGQGAELQPPDPLVRGQPIPGVFEDQPRGHLVGMI